MNTLHTYIPVHSLSGYLCIILVPLLRFIGLKEQGILLPLDDRACLRVELVGITAVPPTVPAVPNRRCGYGALMPPGYGVPATVPQGAIHHVPLAHNTALGTEVYS